MPYTTKRPRVALHIPEETHAAIKRLAAALGQHSSTTVTRLLVDMTPQIEALAEFHERLKVGQRDAAVRALADSLGGSMAELVGAGIPAEKPAGRTGRAAPRAAGRPPRT